MVTYKSAQCIGQCHTRSRLLDDAHKRSSIGSEHRPSLARLPNQNYPNCPTFFITRLLHPDLHSFLITHTHTHTSASCNIPTRVRACHSPCAAHLCSLAPPNYLSTCQINFAQHKLPLQLPIQQQLGAHLSRASCTASVPTSAHFIFRQKLIKIISYKFKYYLVYLFSILLLLAVYCAVTSPPTISLVASCITQPSSRISNPLLD